MKLPQPPLPRSLQRRPARPGSDGAGGNGQRPPTRRARALTPKERAIEVPVSAIGWLDERTGASPFLRGFLFRKVPKGTNWFYTLGSATMFAFLSQAVTGVFLAMYYEPDVSRAYESALADHERALPGRARPRHAPVGLDRDAACSSSSTWGARSSSARTSTRAS